MKGLSSVAIALALVTAGTSCNNAPPPLAFSPNLKQAAEYLRQSYNPDLHLVYESPRISPNTYWIVSENLLVQRALKEYFPAISREIRLELRRWAEEHPELPRNAEGLMISYKHEVLLGETVSLPFRAGVEHILVENAEYTIKTEVCNGGELPDWQEYADLLLYGALSEYYQGKEEEAQKYFYMATLMWDGKGLADKVYEHESMYQTYKPALLLLVSRVLHQPLEFERELVNILYLQQGDSGGFVTHYLLSGVPNIDSDPNSETTAIVLLAFNVE